jgi:rhodanese-related sulfurtransferase
MCPIAEDIDRMQGFNEVDAVELKSLLQQDATNVMLIDVRTPTEIARGGIPGARSIPLHLLPLHLEHLNDERPLVFYCQSGARSAQACAFLAGRGRQRLFNLRGGIIGWVQSGHPVGQVRDLSGAAGFN